MSATLKYLLIRDIKIKTCDTNFRIRKCLQGSSCFIVFIKKVYLRDIAEFKNCYKIWYKTLEDK